MYIVGSPVAALLVALSVAQHKLVNEPAEATAERVQSQARRVLALHRRLAAASVSCHQAEGSDRTSMDRPEPATEIVMLWLLLGLIEKYSLALCSSAIDRSCSPPDLAEKSLRPVGADGSSVTTRRDDGAKESALSVVHATMWPWHPDRLTTNWLAGSVLVSNSREEAIR